MYPNMICQWADSTSWFELNIVYQVHNPPASWLCHWSCCHIWLGAIKLHSLKPLRLLQPPLSAVRWRHPVNCLSSKWLKCVVGCLLPTNSNNMPGMLAGPGPNELEGVWPSELCLWCARHLRMSTWELLCPARCLWPGQSTIIIVMSFH